MTAFGFGADDKVSKSGDTMTGPLTLQGSAPIIIPAGAAAGKLLTSDASGNITLQPAPAAAAPPIAWANVTHSPYNADNTGATDPTTAFSNAIAALSTQGGGLLYVPPGTYNFAGGLVPAASGVRIWMDGFNSTTLKSTSGNPLFNMDPPGFSTSVHVEDFEIWNGTLSTSGGAPIFWGSNVVRCKFVNNFLHPVGNSDQVWLVQNGTGTNNVGYMAECWFIANKEQVGGAARTTESWHLDFSFTGSFSCNDNTWDLAGAKIWPTIGGDTSHYWLALFGSQAGSFGSKGNKFRNFIFELSGVSNAGACGGLMHFLNVEHLLLDGVTSEDLSSGTVGNPLMLFNTVSGGAEGCQHVTIRNYSRRSGSNVSSTNPDLKFDGNSKQVTIDSPGQSSGGTQLTIDLQSAQNVRRTGAWPTSYTLLNATGLSPATAGFTPANPTGTTSASKVMMGLGSACSFTPQGTGQVVATFTGVFRDSGTTGAGTVGGRFGTGTAPANAAGASGTQWGGSADLSVLPTGTSGGPPFALNQLLALTPGTTYWFDLAVSSNGTATAQPQSLAATFVEQP